MVDLKLKVAEVIVQKLQRQGYALWPYISNRHDMGWYCLRCRNRREERIGYVRMAVWAAAEKIAKEGVPTHCNGCYLSFRDIAGEL